MSQLRYRLTLPLIILLSFLGLMIHETISAQDCQDSSDIPGALKHRAPAADGKIHVTYSFNNSNISATAKKAIENAIAQWNNKSVHYSVTASHRLCFQPTFLQD